MRTVKYFDVSPLVSENTAVFPGDCSYTRRVAMDYANGDNLRLSSIETTLHLGAHADAPSHYHPAGMAIDERDLNLYVGRCQVLTVTVPRGEPVLPEHLNGRSITAPRVLLNTGSFSDPDRWTAGFNSLSPELIHFLADKKVVLVGIDTPSVDPAPAKILDSHNALYARDLAVLEGLVLARVPDGVYILTALPLRLRGADASPVRAVLWESTEFVASGIGDS